jgi:hypothetical protein
MDIFVVLTLWVYGLFVVFCLNAVVSATARAIYSVYGVTAQDILVWGIQNPLWFYNLLDQVAPQATQQHNYFGGLND